jgi:soluble lytic murein transglycosylase-like protein
VAIESQGLRSFLLLVCLLTVAGVLVQQKFDGVLAVEEHARIIEEATEKSGLRNPWLLYGVVYAESRGNADSISSVGAMGLGQLMPETARELATRYSVDGPPYSPKDNLLLAAHYLSELLAQFDGDQDLALLAYRQGPGKVSRRILECGGIESYKDAIRTRKPSPWEYRTQVLRFAERFESRQKSKRPSQK